MEENAQQAVEMPKKKWSVGRIIRWSIIILVLLFLVVQYMNAVKYEALVQVIDENRIGVNPTGARLDFGDLPRDKSAVRSVTLESNGNTGSFVVVFKTGDIADLIDVSRNYFTLNPRSNEKIDFSIHVPNSAEYRYYRGKVYIFKLPKLW